LEEVAQTAHGEKAEDYERYRETKHVLRRKPGERQADAETDEWRTQNHVPQLQRHQQKPHRLRSFPDAAGTGTMPSTLTPSQEFIQRELHELHESISGGMSSMIVSDRSEARERDAPSIYGLRLWRSWRRGACPIMA
jgi:hypothetical protein